MASPALPSPPSNWQSQPIADFDDPLFSGPPILPTPPTPEPTPQTSSATPVDDEPTFRRRPLLVEEAEPTVVRPGFETAIPVTGEAQQLNQLWAQAFDRRTAVEVATAPVGDPRPPRGGKALRIVATSAMAAACLALGYLGARIDEVGQLVNTEAATHMPDGQVAQNPPAAKPSPATPVAPPRAEPGAPRVAASEKANAPKPEFQPPPPPPPKPKSAPVALPAMADPNARTVVQYADEQRALPAALHPATQNTPTPEPQPVVAQTPSYAPTTAARAATKRIEDFVQTHASAIAARCNGYYEANMPDTLKIIFNVDAHQKIDRVNVGTLHRNRPVAGCVVSELLRLKLPATEAAARHVRASIGPFHYVSTVEALPTPAESSFAQLQAGAIAQAGQAAL